MNRLSTPRDGALRALAVSGALGCWLGATAFEQWQVAVETAQVVAGLVHYPSDNPFYIYHVRLWTVLHEVLAVLLRLGMSEIAASKLVSGVMGMIGLQALTMVVYAFGRSAPFAVGAAFAVFLGRAAELSGRYPISVMGTEHTYGAVGLSTLLLAGALLGSGRHRLGGLLFGALPAIHPSLGIWALVIASIALAIDSRTRRELLRPALPWFVAGCCVTTASLMAHLTVLPHAAPADPATADYLPTIVKYWDGHRQPAYLDNPAVSLNLAGVPLALVWLRWFSDRLPPASVFLLRFFAVSGGLAVLFVFVSWAPPERIPDVLQILMPLRLLNVVSMMFAAVLLGLIATYGRSWIAQAGILALLVAFLLAPGSLFWHAVPEAVRRVEGLPLGRLTVMLTAGFLATVLATIEKRRRARHQGVEQPRVWRSAGTLAKVRTVFLVAVIALSLASLRNPWPRALKFRDRTHDPVFSAAAAQSGLLLPAHGLRLIQLKTRRAVLLDTSGFDGVVYSLEAAPRMIDILRDVYAIDLLTPPAEAPDATNRRAWQAYSRERWRAIGRTYGVTQVLTPRDWNLDLPLAVETLDLRLYQIP